MAYDLRVASLILVHSNPLSIKFRMDEKQFDVDGAYNIRYEIIKKRIDKAHIKGTSKRLTTPGKLPLFIRRIKMRWNISNTFIFGSPKIKLEKLNSLNKRIYKEFLD